MIPVTPATYFDLNNRVLTRSKIKDFYIDKNYFFRKHIKGEVEKEAKKAFLIGSVVDELITMLDQKNKYAVVAGDGRTKAVKDERAYMEAQGYTVISECDYETIMNISIAVEETDAYKKLIADGYVKQGILQHEISIGDHFDSIASMIDFYKIEGNKCTIVDLKTTQDIDPIRYHFKAISYWYYKQMSINTLLFNYCHPEVTEFEYYNLVVDKTKDIYHTRVFKLANSRVEMELKELQDIIMQIAAEKEFKKYNPSFDNAILIGESQETYWEEE